MSNILSYSERNACKCLYILKFRILFSEHYPIFIYLFIYLFICLLESTEIRGLQWRSKDNSQRVLSEQNHKSLISVSLVLNNFKIDQVYSISYPGQICSIKLKKLKLRGLWSFDSFYNLS